MSDPGKSFPRPKVRFSKSAELGKNTNEHKEFSKPRIRSETILVPKIKILKMPMTNRSFERNSSPEISVRDPAAGDAPNDLRRCPSKSTFVPKPCLAEIVLTPEAILDNVRDPYRINGKLDRISSANVTKRVPSKKTVPSLPEKISRSLSDSDSEKDVPRAKTTVGKENVPSRGSSRNVYKVPANTPTERSKSTNCSSTKISGTSSQQPITKKPVKTLVKASVDSTKTKAKTVSTKKPIASTVKPTETKKVLKKPIGLMPCMKYAKTRSDRAPMKKTIQRDVVGGPVKVYVGPGVPRARSPLPKIEGKRDKSPQTRREINSGDKLARPEYNSIVNTIKELRKVREEKACGDLKRLPAIYQRLVNGKVSSALDYGANEAIYHDLVDLSIDEKQLPSRLTRSKDPEPRQRDLAPKLSDFFVPTNDDEYRRAILVSVPVPRLIDTWTPYRISERIFSWKDSLDRDF